MAYGNGGEAIGGGQWVGGESAGYDQKRMTVAQASAPKRIPMITSQTEDLARQVEQLQQNAAQLEQRLALILQPSVPTDTPENAKAIPSHSVPYAQALGELTMRVAAANRRLADILQRIEL